MPSADLPAGASSLNENVEFPEGAVRTRAGLQPVFPALPNLATVNGLKTYPTPSFVNRLMAWDALGSLWRYDDTGARILVSGSGLPSLLFHSFTVFGREYEAFYTGNTGGDIPRQYDDANFDRVSQVGPGVGPAVSNFLPVAATIASPAPAAPVNILAPPNGAVRSGTITGTYTHYEPDYSWNPYLGQWYISGYHAVTETVTLSNFVTIKTAAAHLLVPGQTVTVAGVTDATFNGTFLVYSTPAADLFTYYQNGTHNATSGNGTSTGLSGAIERKSNIVTVNTTAAHGFSLGWTVRIAGEVDIGLPGAITSMTGAGGVVTVVMNAPHLIQVGTRIIVAGVTDATFNGIFLVQTVPSATTFTYSALTLTGTAVIGGATISTGFNGDFVIASIPTATSFTYNDIGPDSSQSTALATATIIGNVSAGLHQCSVSFITRQGFITAPAPPNSFSAAGGQLLSVSGIPIGPANVVGRLLMFTLRISQPATSGPFYSLLATMQIKDNTTTSVVVDFLDTSLAAGFACSWLFGQQELGECASVGGYNSRLIWLGERAKVSNFVNLPFEGGWNLAGGIGASDVPLGWTSDATSGAGGSRDTVNSAWMDAYRITGNGAAALRGMITQSAYQDYLGVGILTQGVSYSYRVRLLQTGLTQGNFAIEVYSVSLGSLGLATVAYSAMPTTGALQEFIGVLMVAQTVIPADALLRVYGSGTLTLNGWFVADSIEIFPTLFPVDASDARVSYVNNPEGYDGVTGRIGVRRNDGQTLRAQFPMGNNRYYFGKDNYLCYVVDDGVNESALWPVNEVSATIGICGPNALDWTEEWAVFAHRTGFYLCLGSDPIKVNQEIMEDASNSGEICWNSINWLYGHTIWVRIDALNKQILVGAPVNGATSPNIVFMMDYKFASTAEHIAAGPGVAYGVFSGRLASHGAARKWTIWNITAPCCAFVQRPDGTVQDFYGNGVANGLIYNRPAGHYLDDGVAVNSFWDTSPLPSSDQEQALQLRAHRKLYGYMTGRATGSAALPGAVVTMVQTGPGFVDVVMTVPHGLAVDDWVIVSGASDTTYNGYWQVVGTPNPVTFVYAAVTTLPAALGATVSGTLNLSAITTVRTKRIRGVQLSATPVGDFERSMNVHAERAVFRIGTSVPGGNFQLEKLFVSMAPDPTMPVRGSGL